MHYLSASPRISSLRTDIQITFTPYWQSVYLHFILTFSLSLTPYWHSVYHLLRTDIQYNIHSILTFITSFTPYWHLVYHSLRTDFQYIIHSILTYPHVGIKYITSKNWREWYTKLHEWLQQLFVSKLLIYLNWDFLKKKTCTRTPDDASSRKISGFEFP